MFLAIQVTTASPGVPRVSFGERKDAGGGATEPVPMASAPPPPVRWTMISAEELNHNVLKDKEKILIIDSRSFLEYNTCHVRNAVNVCCSKLVKRRLQQDKVTVKDLLSQACRLDMEEHYDIIVYDQCSTSTDPLASDCFLMVLLSKLVDVFNSVAVLTGGFLNYQASHPSLCETKSMCSTASGNYKCAPLTSMSQPCMSTTNVGPTKILPFLYLGSQQDALSQDTTKLHGVKYILNVSTTCPKPTFIQDSHFHRIPVIDNYSDKLLPHFKEAFQFIDKVREANGCVLVHCLAGISRSPTIAIAYVMKYLHITSEEAYKYVKDKRPTISPNFNFLGQLFEFQKLLKKQTEKSQKAPSPEGNVDMTEVSSLGGAIKKEVTTNLASSLRLGMRKSFSLQFIPQRETPVMIQSPTTALARLNFNSAPSPIEESAAESPSSAQSHLNFPQYPTTSLDKLSFTPCFTTRDESPRSRHSSHNNNNTKTCGGTKRPLSVSGLDNTPPDVEASSSEISTELPSRVQCRSPQSRAKRPLVRPNSIAFSTFPRFDLSEMARMSERQGSPLRSSPSQSSPSRGRTSASTTPDRGEDKMDTMCQVEGGPAELRHKEPDSMVGLQNLARKSQSLEDILNSQEEEEWSLGNQSLSHHTVQAADFFSQPLALDRVQGRRCRGPSDTHQSSSSISSSSSHTSLQGSLEMIPVS